MKSFFAEFFNLTDKEKTEILLLMIMLLICTCLVLLAFSWSRGNDVDYFKERIVLIEHRLTGMDKRMSDHDIKFDKIIEATNETRQKLNDEIARNNEQEKWIEYWKTLPQLPQPKPQHRR